VTADQSPGEFLALLMRRRGWSAARLAEVARGVSASSVRAYTSDATVPRPRQALAVANALGPKDGRALLEAWSFPDLAAGFYDEWRQAMTQDDTDLSAAADAYYRHNLIEYPGEPLSEPALGVIRSVIAWFQRIEASTGDAPLP